MNSSVVTAPKWVRSKEGWICGICQGLGERFDMPVGILRLLWVVSIFCFGVGFFMYFILAFCLPREDKLAHVYDRKVFGVCSLLAQKYGQEVGLMRFIWVLFLGASFGSALLVYIVLALVLPKDFARVSTNT